MVRERGEGLVWEGLVLVEKVEEVQGAFEMDGVLTN